MENKAFLVIESIRLLNKRFKKHIILKLLIIPVMST